MQERSIRVLLIESAPDAAEVLQALLRESKAVSFDVIWKQSLAEGLQLLDAGGIDVVLFDLTLTEGNWLESLERIQAKGPHVAIIVLSSLDDETAAVQAVHEGAQDYLVKSEIDRPALVRAIRYALERERAEQAMAQTEAKYRSIFEHTTEGIFQTTADGHYISANPALAAIYGYTSPEELIRGLTDIRQQLYVEPDRRAEFIRLMEEHDVVTGFESKIYRKDGSVIWITENVRAVRDAKHRILYYEGTVEDITEKRRAEEELRNSETLYHSLVENLPQYIFRKDLNERFTFANQRFCQTLGKRLDEIIGKTDFDFFPPELATKYQNDDRIVTETGKMMEIVEEYQPVDGEKLYITVVKTPLHDSKGNIIGLQGIFWDITEKKRAEERLRKTTVELAKSRQELQAKNEQLEEDLKMAREIQQAILPQQYPTFPQAGEPKDSALRFFHRYIPSGAVGGDFFNVVALSDTKAGIFICDVMGHGVRSALVTAIIRTLVEELTPIAANPGQLLGQINREMRSILKQSGSILFTTAFYGVLDLETHRFCYANAGHPKPFLIHRTAGEVEPLPSANIPSAPALGLFDGSAFKTAECSVEAGDLLMLYTDGMYDVAGPNQDAYNPEWLLSQVSQRLALPVTALFDELLAELRTASESGELADDVCVVGVEIVR